MKKQPYTVRFDPWILAETRAIAKYERRSINDEILYILERYINRFHSEHEDYPGTDLYDEYAAGLTDKNPDEDYEDLTPEEQALREREQHAG